MYENNFRHRKTGAGRAEEIAAKNPSILGQAGLLLNWRSPDGQAGAERSRCPSCGASDAPGGPSAQQPKKRTAQ